MAILDPGMELKMRPIKYPQFYEHYKNSIKNTWTVEEISFVNDIADIREKLSTGEKHIVSRILAFFATGDLLVMTNCVRNLMRHVNSPDAHLYYTRQAAEEALHQDFYNILLDNYIPDMTEREAMFDAVNTLPSVKAKADFMIKWFETTLEYDQLDTDTKKREFLLNMITFACAVEGLQFMASFVYVFWLRSKGMLNGLGDGTQWVFRDETMHMNFAFDVIDVIRAEYPQLWDRQLEEQIVEMLTQAIEVEKEFAQDALSGGVAGLSADGIVNYLKYIADQHLNRLKIDWHRFDGKNEYEFMVLQDLEEHANFFERKPTMYAIGNKMTSDGIGFDEDF